MGFIDTSSPTKWGIFKIIAVILCLLIIVGIFLPWVWSEAKTKVGAVEITARYEAVGTDFSDAWTIFFAVLLSLLFIFLGYDINVCMPDKPRRINELLSGMLAFLIFIDSAVVASMISRGARTVAAGAITLSAGIGAGLWIILVSSFFMMVFSFLLWRQKSQAQAPVTVAPVQVPAPPASVSKEEAIAALAKIQGVTIKKAISLYDAGFRSLSDLCGAPPESLLAIKGITLEDVKNIKKGTKL
jgi:hypothetical protein